jgi:hypothetical protein
MQGRCKACAHVYCSNGSTWKLAFQAVLWAGRGGTWAVTTFCAGTHARSSAGFAFFRYVKRAMHGTRLLSWGELRETYGRELVNLRNEARYAFLNTLFSVSEAVMFCQARLFWTLPTPHMHPPAQHALLRLGGSHVLPGEPGLATPPPSTCRLLPSKCCLPSSVAPSFLAAVVRRRVLSYSLSTSAP